MNCKENDYINPPFTHSLAHVVSSRGYRVSRVLWKIAYKVNTVFVDGTIVKLQNGFILEIDSRDWTSRTIYEGTYERSLLRVLSFVQAKNLVIDVGANIGITLWSSIKHNQEVSYLAFEPAPIPFDRLQRFLSFVNNIGHLHKIGLSDRNGIAQLYGVDNPDHTGLASYSSEESPFVKGVIETEVRTLDKMLEEIKLDKDIDLIKIDVEGFEGNVLRGAENVLIEAKFRFLILEVSPEFGDISYLEWLYSKTCEQYTWFLISEQGRLRKSTYIIPIDLGGALLIANQCNLIIMKKGEVDKFRDIIRNKSNH